MRFVDGSKAAAHLDGHTAWLQQGFADEVFFYVGGIHGGGGAVILAAGITSDDLVAAVNEDPFVMKVCDSRSHRARHHDEYPRLAFMVEFHRERLGYQADRAG